MDRAFTRALARTSVAALAASHLGLAAPAHRALAQGTEAERAAVAISVGYRVVPNLVYHVAAGHESRLDLYVPRAAGPAPTLIQIHGGGWVGGSKEATSLRLLPYLEMGWAVANIGYRLADVSLAPAAVEDALCALRWVIRNADEYGLDTDRIVVTGYSAGGHLALTTGMVPPSAGLDRQCPGTEPLRVAAIVNWYGITDVADLLEGPNMRAYAVEWLGSMPNRVEVARRVSPLSYVRADLPPVLTIHGDADPTVPYTHAVRLHEELTRAGVPNRLHTVSGGGHGNFSLDEHQRAFAVVRSFLREHLADR